MSTEPASGDRDRTVGVLLRRLCEHAPQLPQLWQRRALHWGVTHGDEDLLAALASRRGLHPEVDDALAANTAAAVRAAWIGSHADDPTSVAALIGTESRPSLLAKIAATPNLDLDALERIAERCNAPQLALVLLETGRLEAGTCVTLAGRVAASATSFKGSNWERVRELVATNPHLVDAMVAEVTAAAHATKLIGVAAPGPEAVAALLDRLVTPLLTSPPAKPGWLRHTSTLLVTLERCCSGNPDTVGVVVDAMEALIGAHPEGVGAAVRAAVARRTLQGLRDRLDAAEGSAATALRVEVVAELTSRLGEQNAATPSLQELGLVWELLRSGDLDDDTFEILADTAALHASFIVAAPDGLDLRCCEVALRNPSASSARLAALLTRAEDRAGALRLFTQRYGAARLFELTALTDVLTVSEMREALAAAPLRSVTWEGGPDPWANPENGAALLDVLEATGLGEDDIVWEAFCACADQLSGSSISELAALAAAVTNEP